MKKIIFILIIIISSFFLRYAWHQVWLSSASTPYKLTAITPVFAEQYILLGQKIDVNSASRSDLIALPGIGEKMADRIMTVRSALGGFKKIEDLREVKGIGEKTLTKLKKYLSCAGE